MSWPSGVSLATVTFGRFWDSLALTSGTVQGQVSRTHPLVWEATGERFGTEPTPLPQSIGGLVEFQAAHTDQAGFLHADTLAPFVDWGYEATLRVTYDGGRSEIITRRFQIVDGQEVVDLDYLPSGELAQGVSLPHALVTSINGQTGAVVVSGGGVGTPSADVSWAAVTDKPTTFPPSAHQHPTTAITGLSTVATSGSYADLVNKPIIPTLPSLSAVAVSGAYSDLIGRPVIPTTAAQVGADPVGSASAAQTAAQTYTDTAVANLSGGTDGAVTVTTGSAAPTSATSGSLYVQIGA